MTDVIEAMARAAYGTLEIEGGAINVRVMVRAALAAALERGWKLVPMNLAEAPSVWAMMRTENEPITETDKRWRAMIQSSPEVK